MPLNQPARDSDLKKPTPKGVGFSFVLGAGTVSAPEDRPTPSAVPFGSDLKALLPEKVAVWDYSGEIRCSSQGKLSEKILFS